MDNKKVVELADNFHTEINSTKDEFTKKINLQIDQIEKKMESSRHDDLASSETYREHIAVFSKNFTRIKNTIGVQNASISKLATMCRILVCIAVMYTVVILIVLFKHPDSHQKTTTSSVAGSVTATVSTTTVEPSQTATVEPSQNSTKAPAENFTDDYSKLSKDYKLAYIKAVNSNDRSDLNKFVSTGSPFDKYITQKLSDAKDLKLELQSSKVEKTESKDEYIYIYVVENLGVKESNADSFKYSEYKVKYTIKKSGDSYIFEKQENL